MLVDAHRNRHARDRRTAKSRFYFYKYTFALVISKLSIGHHFRGDERPEIKKRGEIRARRFNPKALRRRRGYRFCTAAIIFFFLRYFYPPD